MPYLNKAMLIGNIGKDPEIKVSQGGKKRVGFTLATSRKFKDANGETREQTDWHSVVGWGKSADIIEQLGIRKGTTIYVEGAIVYRSWDDRETGQRRYATEISMDTFQILTPRGNGDGNRQAAPRQQPGPQAGTRQGGNAYGQYSQEDEDGLPF